MAAELEIELAEVVAGLLTPGTTKTLPEAWRGDYSVERAAEWIKERDADSSTMLVVESAPQHPVGLVILSEVSLDDTSVDLRIGFLLTEDVWGRGLASELLAGLTGWARTRPEIRTLTGGVETTNRASARVLEKNGFHLIGGHDDGTLTYRFDIGSPG